MRPIFWWDEKADYGIVLINGDLLYFDRYYAVIVGARELKTPDDFEDYDLYMKYGLKRETLPPTVESEASE